MKDLLLALLKTAGKAALHAALQAVADHAKQQLLPPATGLPSLP